MIAHLKGTLSLRGAEEVVIDVNGVGYLVQMTGRDLHTMPEVGEPVFVHIMTHFRDGAITLFGFKEESVRSVFSRLIAISGVGPKLGLGILSTLTVPELWDATHSGSTAGLQRIPGVGPKKARRLVIDLKDMFAKLDTPIRSAKAPAPSSGAAQVGHGVTASGPASAAVWGDLRSAMQNLGYPESKVEDVIMTLRREGATGSFDELLREALTQLR